MRCSRKVKEVFEKGWRPEHNVLGPPPFFWLTIYAKLGGQRYASFIRRPQAIVGMHQHLIPAVGLGHFQPGIVQDRF